MSEVLGCVRETAAVCDMHAPFRIYRIILHAPEEPYERGEGGIEHV